MTNAPGVLLVVDDDPMNRDLLCQRCRREGYETEEAEDGLQALEKLAGRAYALVLLDIRMPRLDGFDVLERMKANAELRRIPVVVISAVGEVDSIARCLELGADDYLTKPFDATILRARIAACLERKRLREQEQSLLCEVQSLNAGLQRRVDEATRDLRSQAEALECHVRELTALSRVSIAINSAMDMGTVLGLIMDLSREVMGAEASSLLMVDKAAGKLRFHVARGSAAEALREHTVELGQGIAGWVAATGRPLLIPDAYEDSRFDPSHDRQSGFRTRSLVTVPIRGEREQAVVGVVQVINKVGGGAFDLDGLRLFQSFAGMAGVALENARLFGETRKMAEDLRAALEQERRLTIEKGKMGAYVPRSVLDEISRNREQKLALGGKTVRATILFSDVQGFTRLSETMEPQRVVGFLNEYMTAMTAIVEEEGGIVDKFIGDGLMSVFLPRDATDNHALRAVRTGVRMQLRMRELKAGWRVTRPDVAEVAIRVGINTGEVVSGNIGSETRMDYTVVGDNVNVASRIESNGRPGEVHVSQSTYEAIQAQLGATRLEPIHVKNRTQPVQVYSVDVVPLAAAPATGL
ncbi:MAG: response regulator [Planctomycetes bacterium]|nr:response regulator [Planctomycetota bacterium]